MTIEELIKVSSEDIQNKILYQWGLKVPLYQVYNKTNNYYNSSLYFEVWLPSAEYVNICSK